MEFRIATHEDINQLIPLGLMAYGEYFPVLSEQNKNLMETNLQKPELYENILGIGIGFVALKEEKIIGMGFLIYSGNPTHIYPADWSYIRMIAINPQFKGLGLASKITELCIEEAIKKNEKIIGLHTSEMMPAARHIYEKKGFVISRELEPIFGKKYWLYSLNLKN
jgi:ribosomal protein S18 acetylase RimI-like enzyme